MNRLRFRPGLKSLALFGIGVGFVAFCVVSILLLVGDPLPGGRTLMRAVVYIPALGLAGVVSLAAAVYSCFRRERTPPDEGREDRR